ncbi:putative pentatricopeptide repeat-containing protein [Acorus calamus]|uniref:Pentatricopeptide repeat-containing protein n=1 Tax=Acorus calamus TaxID=4465 RepID=A0AAV9CPQ3_ACOCL|nr:putative pentatricopeptide repeat-containing protein [Acorus calamus]
MILLRSLLRSDIPPQPHLLATALKSSAAVRSLLSGRLIHSLLLKLGHSSSPVLLTALMDLHLKSGSLPDAHKLFDELPQRDAFSWSSMIVGLSHQNQHTESLHLFKAAMVALGGRLDPYAFSGALLACSALRSIEPIKQIHAKIATSDSLNSNSFLTNGLINAYAQCGCFSLARTVYARSPEKDAVAFNALASGLLQHGRCETVLNLLASMVSEGESLHDFVYTASAKACARLASLKQGTQVHARAVKSGFGSHAQFACAMVDMYAKCGCIDDAGRVFDLAPPCSRDVALWTAVIDAFGKAGRVEEALELFDRMDVRPDGVAYLSVLCACKQRGMVRHAFGYFKMMIENDKIEPWQQHHACMVDLLSKERRPEELMEVMRGSTSVSAWVSFLECCRSHGKGELARVASRMVREVDPENHSNLVLLSNLFAEGGEWEEACKIRKAMKKRRLKKEPGCSWVEGDDGVHVFGYS